MHGDARRVGRDQPRSLRAHGVARGIDLDAEESQPVGRLGAYHRVVLADARRERERVEPAHHRRVGADVLPQPVHVDVEPEARIDVAGGDETVHLAACRCGR